jgi:hypothetical protein
MSNRAFSVFVKLTVVSLFVAAVAGGCSGGGSGATSTGGATTATGGNTRASGGTTATGGATTGSGAKTWRCQVSALSLGGDVCICDDTGDPGTQSERCPATETCCFLAKAPNASGVTECTCFSLSGLLAYTSGADVTSVPTCPPGYGNVICDAGGDQGGRCGDGVVAAGEECDCGDGTVPVPPSCPGPNNDNTYYGCTTKCTLGPHCGDSILDPGEECDLGPLNGAHLDANGNPTDAGGCPSCNTDCMVHSCVL